LCVVALMLWSLFRYYVMRLCNGVLLKQGVDYTLGPAGITFVPAAIPQPGDSLLVSFRR
jgi:hypothetical protein